MDLDDLDLSMVEVWDATDEGVVPASAAAVRAQLRYGYSAGAPLSWQQLRQLDDRDGYTHVRIAASELEGVTLPRDCEAVQVAVDFAPGCAGIGSMYTAASDADYYGSDPDVRDFDRVTLHLTGDRMRSASVSEMRAVHAWCDDNEAYICDLCVAEHGGAR